MSFEQLAQLQKDFQNLAERKQALKKSGTNIWTRRILARYNRKTNSNVATTGEPGIGKSTLSLTMAEDLKPEVFVDKPNEAVEKFVTFSGGELGRAIKNSADGSLIIGDEFGQQMHHRQFMSEKNVALSNVLQGFRFKRFICFLNLPGLAFIDADAERLLTWLAIVNKQGEAEVHRVTHPKFKGKDFYPTEISLFRFRKPKPDLWGAYVEKKIRNQERVFDQSIKAMDQDEAVELSNEEIAKMIADEPKKYSYDNDENRLDAKKIQAYFGVGVNRGYTLKTKAEIEMAKKRDPSTPVSLSP